MRDDLAAFLRATELEELLAARERITMVTDDDAEVLHDIVTSWSDDQAVANLLMYPELLPEPDRSPALAAGLSGSHGGYAVLAASVGLSSWVVDDADAPAVAERLLALIEDPTTPRPTAVRAAIALAEYAEHLAPTEIALALTCDDEAVRHNVLAASLLAWGPVETLAAVGAVVASGRVPAEVAELVEQRLVGAGLTDVDEPVQEGALVDVQATPIPTRSIWAQTVAT